MTHLYPRLKNKYGQCMYMVIIMTRNR